MKLFSRILLAFIGVISGCLSTPKPIEDPHSYDDPVYEDYFLYTGISDQVKDLDPVALANLMYTHTDEDLYLDIRNKASTFTLDEYDLYYRTLFDLDVAERSAKGLLSDDEVVQLYEESKQLREQLDQKAMDRYGKLLYQLPFQQALEL